MRLINTHSLALKEFSKAEPPPYAILSHRWEDDEVNLQQFTQPAYRHCRGYRKIKDFCQQALADGFEWGWADTCCINKAGNDNELSEAINSMFAWYHDAGRCYVYLSDVTNPRERNVPPSVLERVLRSSKWFTRGWTLQELIAPLDILFFDRNWRLIGTRNRLSSIISRITRIDERLLRNEKDLRSFSVAQRMSWAAYRCTTRPEDRAYSLFGLFGITLPTIYGEGEGAFRKLQEEIMKTSSDQSLFAWVLNVPLKNVEPWRNFRHGILAPSPDCFFASSSIVPYSYVGWDAYWSHFADVYCKTNISNRCTVTLAGEPKKVVPLADSGPYTITNKGLQIKLLVKKIDHSQYQEAALFCYDESVIHPRPFTIILNDQNERAKPYYLGRVRRREHGKGHSHWQEVSLVIPRLWNAPDGAGLLGDIDLRRDTDHDYVDRLEDRAFEEASIKRSHRTSSRIFGGIAVATLGWTLLSDRHKKQVQGAVL